MRFTNSFAGTLRFELRKAVLETAVITISPRPYTLIILGKTDSINCVGKIEELL